MPPHDAANRDTAGSLIEWAARAIKAGGMPLVLLVLMGLVVWLSVRPVTADAPDRYTGTMAARDWAEQRGINVAIQKALESLAVAQTAHEGIEWHAGTRATIARIDANIAEILRRIDRMEKDR